MLPSAPHLIVLCGSMAHHAAMRSLADTLRAKGLDVVVPADERHLAPPLSAAARDKFKRAVSRRYFRLIRRRSVFAILVVNRARHGKRNYIGPNTLAEIAIAVDARKRIFLLHGFDPALADELRAWGAVPLRGDLAPLVRAARRR